MGAWTLIETDSTPNKDIRTAVAVGVRTVGTAGRVGVLVLTKEVAGNGDYIIYLTLTRSAVEHRMSPITTAPVASGVTTPGFSGEVWAAAGDVLTVYLDGLAGDETTPDISVDWFEGAGATAAALNTVSSNVSTILSSVTSISGDMSGLADAFVLKLRQWLKWVR